MVKRTPEEIAAQIAGLKKERKTIPERSSFGDKNWEKIDAQIAVLEGKKTPQQFYVDEEVEEYSDGDNDVYFAAEQAEGWLNGSRKKNLYDE